MSENNKKYQRNPEEKLEKEKTIEQAIRIDIVYDLIIIGAGPSGLFCAINSSQKGMKILILEKKDSPGHKLLISGSGHCNITNNRNMHSFLNHYGNNGRFLRPALLNFTNCDLISFFEKRGLAMIQGNDSKIFPATSHSRDVLNILINECKSLGVILFCNQHVRSITRVGTIFEVRSLDKIYRSTNLVIATGGCSYPTTGSTGDGYRFAKDLGHSIVEIGPSLTPVYAKEYPFADLAGLSFSDISISLYRHKKIKYQKGDVLLTHQGLSGPAILDLSRYIRVGDTLKISFISPDRQKELEKWLIDKSRIEGNSGARSALLGLSNSDSLSPRLIKRIFEISGIPLDIRCAHLTKEMRGQLIDNLTGFPIVVSDLGGFNIAMVTKGGIELNEVNPKRMESKLIKGLYFIGEVLDIDGDTGGYNLQAAFSTGMLAARSIINSYLEIKN